MGGWRSQGGTRTQDARRFSITLDRKNAKWAYARGEPFRSIAALEAVGILLGVILLTVPGDNIRPCGGMAKIRGFTDNRGNQFALTKLMSTKWPLTAIIMELSEQLCQRRMMLGVEWIPRDQNEEADALTNDDFSLFSPERRIDVKLEEIKFAVLEGLLEESEKFHTEIKQRKEEGAGREKAHERKGPRDRAGTKRRKLRYREPW